MNDEMERSRSPRLIDLLITILKYKGWFISVLVLSLTGALLYQFLSKGNSKPTGASVKTASFFFSESTVELDRDYVERIKPILMSRSIAIRIAEVNNLNSISQRFLDDKGKSIAEPVYGKNDKTQKWIALKKQDGMDALVVKVNNSSLVIQSISNNPELPQKLILSYLNAVSDFVRKPALAHFESKKKLLEEQISVARDPALKEKLFEMYSNLMDKYSRAKTSEYYGLEIIDSPFAPESMDAFPSVAGSRINYKIVAMFVFLCFAIALALAFLWEYFTTLKKRDPDRFQLIQKYRKLKINSRKGA